MNMTALQVMTSEHILITAGNEATPMDKIDNDLITLTEKAKKQYDRINLQSASKSASAQMTKSIPKNVSMRVNAQQSELLSSPQQKRHKSIHLT